MLYLKRGAALAREMKWLGSHRFAVLNLSARDRAELYARTGHPRHARLRPPRGPEPVPLWSGTQRDPQPDAASNVGDGA